MRDGIFEDFEVTGTVTGRFISKSPNRANSPKIQPPKVPTSGKECKKMLNAVAYRLAHMLQSKTTTVFHDPNLWKTVKQKFPPRSRGRPEIMLLVRKFLRLQSWYTKHKQRDVKSHGA